MNSDCTCPYFRHVQSEFQRWPDYGDPCEPRTIRCVSSANVALETRLMACIRRTKTFIRPGMAPGTLLSMVEELPYFDEAVPLTRLRVFSTADNTMSLNMFVYGNKATVSVRPIDSEAVQKILKVAADVQEGKYAGAPHHLEPHPQFDKEALLQYLQKCSNCSDCTCP